MNIFDEVKDAKTIAICGHARPDGDCVGSVMGLALYLRKVLPDTHIDVLIERPSENFRPIFGEEKFPGPESALPSYDVFFALDCNRERLEKAVNSFDASRKKINIDHHISNHGCGDINIVEPNSSSTSELVYELIPKEDMDAEIAQALYLGIVHDTGVFHYSCTSPKTLRIAADLIGYGFDFSKLIDETYYQKTYIQTQIMGRAVLESIRFLDGRAIVSMVDRKTMEFYQIDHADLEGIVNQLRIVKGVECAIFMREIDTLRYKVSLRSNTNLDVAVIAEQFGGGGHVRAAGCTMNGTYHDNINNLSKLIAEQLDMPNRNVEAAD